MTYSMSNWRTASVNSASTRPELPDCKLFLGKELPLMGCSKYPTCDVELLLNELQPNCDWHIIRWMKLKTGAGMAHHINSQAVCRFQAVPTRGMAAGTASGRARGTFPSHLVPYSRCEYSVRYSGVVSVVGATECASHGTTVAVVEPRSPNGSHSAPNAT